MMQDDGYLPTLSPLQCAIISCRVVDIYLPSFSITMHNGASISLLFNTFDSIGYLHITMHESGYISVLSFLTQHIIEDTSPLSSITMCDRGSLLISHFIITIHLEINYPCICGRFTTERGMKIHRTKMGC